MTVNGLLKYKQPINATEISERIISDRGGFADGYNYLESLFSSKFNGSLILRGPPGIGKKSLVSMAAKSHKLNTILISPYLQSDDMATLKKIADHLKVPYRNSIPNMVEDIGRILKKSGVKVVIVLNNLEEFCRDTRQSLLYQLTDLVQHGKNICFIGITISLTCLDGLEKRVRSRLSSLSYDLKPPYSNVDEYIEFASLLLGGYQFTEDFQDQLEFLYNFGYRSLTYLKQYLISVCEWDSDNKLTVNYTKPEDRNLLIPRNRASYSKDRFLNLTKDELFLCTMACLYCIEEDKNIFKLNELERFTKRHNQPKFRASDANYIQATVSLSECRLFCPVDKNDSRLPVCEMTKFCLGFTAHELKQVNLKETIKLNLVWNKL